MELLRINAKPRERKAKGDNRRLRQQGLVPAVIYGGAKQPQSIVVDDHTLEMILRGARRTNSVFEVTIGDTTDAAEQTIIRDMQRHPVNSRLVHIDFQRVDLEQEIEVNVPIHAVGADPKGVKAGGILEHVARTILVRCKPLNIPQRIDADLSNLDINQSLHVSDLTLPEGVEVMDEPETPLFTILPPKAEAEPTAEAGAAEPEVIGQKKAEEEE